MFFLSERIVLNNAFYGIVWAGHSVGIASPDPAMSLQPDLPSTLPLWQAALALGPALACAAAALLARPGSGTAPAWRAARRASAAATGLAALSLLAVLAGHTGSGFGLRADAVGGVVMLLVAFVGWVIVRYSQPCLNGERGERHYVRWLMATLAAVGLVVATNHVLVLALAWAATSLALHRLLTFFGDRPAAVVAAHKKFIVGRIADIAMLAAAGLLYGAFGTMQIDQIASQAVVAPLPISAQFAVLLVACAALLKCAQLPFHGWLIQVMEAPTPVSALLHAGVVNLGGFVLLRFAPLVGEVFAAQALLMVAGTLTAVLAALVMTTRISIKVMLAWSTTAQMGFMLMQCGLGLWAMALLHLVAHSLYKAHAFLGAGGAVRRATLVQLTPRAAAPGPLALVLGALTGVGMVWAAGVVVALLLPSQTGVSPAVAVLAGIVALALVPLVHAQPLRLGGLWLPALGAGAFGVALAHFGLHALASVWVMPAASVVPDAVNAPAGLWLGVALAFAVLFLLQSLITVAPHGAIARRLYPWFYGGLFLDERFTRIALGLWRPPGPAAAAAAPLPSHSVGNSTDTTPAGARA
jgi:NAD(P)H-quinone oxidoreductase subunit 5